jgi:predicted PurR-regulated permease PerM
MLEGARAADAGSTITPMAEAQPECPAEPTDAPEVTPLTLEMPVDVRNLALTVIAVLAVVLVLQLMQSVLIPVVLGILISYALSPIVKGLARIRIPRFIAAFVAVSLLVAVVGLSLWAFSDDAMAVVRDIPATAQRVAAKLRAERHRASDSALQQVQEAATQIDKAVVEAAKPAPTAEGIQKVEVVDPGFRATDYLWMGGQSLIGFGGQFTVILFLVYFLLVTDDLYKRKVVKIAGPTLTKKKITVNILDEINRQIENFIKVQVLTSVIVGFATGFALWWFDVDHFVIWGLLAGIFNSVPYLGPIIVSGGLGVVAYMQFDDLWRAFYVSMTALGITSLEGFVLTPMLMSRAAQMNPVAIFVGLLFWSWVWGIWGTILAVPMLMMIKAVCDHVEDLQPVGELLGE